MSMNGPKAHPKPNEIVIAQFKGGVGPGLAFVNKKGNWLVAVGGIAGFRKPGWIPCEENLIKGWMPIPLVWCVNITSWPPCRIKLNLRAK